MVTKDAIPLNVTMASAVPSRCVSLIELICE